MISNDYNATAQEIIDRINEFVDSDNDLSQNVSKLHKLSKDFLQSSKYMYVFLQRKEKEAKELYKNAKALKDGGLDSTEAYAKYGMSMQFTKNESFKKKLTEYYKNAFAYQKNLLELFGIVISTKIVFRNNKEIEVYEIDYEDLVLDIDKNRGKVTARYPASLKKFNEQYKQLMPLSVFDDNPAEAGEKKSKLVSLNTTYNTVYYRYGQSLKQTGQREYLRHYVLWGYEPNMHAYKVGNAGHLAEGYLAIWVSIQQSKPSSFPFLADLESRIGAFIMNYVAVTDSVAGAFRGDITNFGTELEVAAKSAGASAMSITPLIEIAEDIVEASADKDKLKKVLARIADSHQTKDAKQKTAQAIEELVTEEIPAELIASILKGRR